jgi:hypothetical protein
VKAESGNEPDGNKSSRFRALILCATKENTRQVGNFANSVDGELTIYYNEKSPRYVDVRNRC